MSTDSDKPTGIMSAARLAAVREDANDCREALADGTLDFEPCEQEVYDAAHRLIAEGAPALLAHLAALQAPAPDDGGEALGHRLYSILYPHVERTSPEGWRAMMGDGRERYVEAALALDAAGYARGLAAGRSETTRHLIEQRNLAQRTAEDAHREIARLTAALSDAERLMGAAIDNGATDRARALTAEADLDAAQREYIEATERADIAEATVGNLRAELAEARALHEAVVEQKIAAHAEEVRLLAKRDAEAIAAARLDVAREERRLCLEDIATIQRAPHPEYSGAIRVLGQAIDAIRARTEGRQG